MQYRKNECEGVRFRTDRCFTVENKWYFSTREGQNMGPFASRGQAMNAIERYIASVHLAKQSDGEVLTVANDGVWDTVGIA